MQLKVTNLKLCITGGRGSNKEISLFLDSENWIYFFELPYIHIYEYYVKMAVIFLTIIFNEKVDP